LSKSLPGVHSEAANYYEPALVVSARIRSAERRQDQSTWLGSGPCLADAAAVDEHRPMFNKLLAWGLSMAVVGTVRRFVLF
jgi:hypothetical protein